MHPRRDADDGVIVLYRAIHSYVITAVFGNLAPEPEVVHSKYLEISDEKIKKLWKKYYKKNAAPVN